MTERVDAQTRAADARTATPISGTGQPRSAEAA